MVYVPICTWDQSSITLKHFIVLHYIKKVSDSAIKQYLRVNETRKHVLYCYK